MKLPSDSVTEKTSHTFTELDATLKHIKRRLPGASASCEFFPHQHAGNPQCTVSRCVCLGPGQNRFSATRARRDAGDLTSAFLP
jgi:hypothetical protein